MRARTMLFIVVIVVLALLSGVLGWQVYSMRQSVGGQTSVLSQRNAELTRLRQTLTEKDAELARLRQSLTQKDADLIQERQAGIRANQIYLDVSKERIWHIRAGQSLVIGEIVLAVAPQVNGIELRMAAALRPGLLGNPRSVRVLTTAPNWGADDKVWATTEGVVRVQYQFPLAVTEATIALAP